MCYIIEPGSPFQTPLIKFLLRYPQQSVDMFLNENNISDHQWNRCFLVSFIFIDKVLGYIDETECTCCYNVHIYNIQKMLKKQEDGKAFREVLQANPMRLVNLAFGQIQVM